MTEFIEYAGRRFWLQSSGRYFQSGVKTDEERLLHRRIWSDAHGPIPPEHHIHHIDGDWRNNALENLECILGVEHCSEHMRERLSTEEGMAAARRALDAARDAAKAWHASAEGHEWHAAHGARTFGQRETNTLWCEACGGQFETRNAHIARYCSSACAQRVGFKRYFTDERSCSACGQTFMANRHRPTQYCSRACSVRHKPRGNIAQRSAGLATKRSLVCEQCEKPFETIKPSGVRYCSSACQQRGWRAQNQPSAPRKRRSATGY